MTISFCNEGTCLCYTEQIIKIIFFKNLTSVIMKISGVLILITGIGMLNASYMYGIPLLTPSYLTFGIGGGILVLGYGASCLFTSFQGMVRNLKHVQDINARLRRQN